MLVHSKGRCYRIEERTIIPGPLVTVKGVGGGFNGTTTQMEQNHCYIIVNSRTERYFGKSRREVIFTSELRPSDYFTSKEEAEQTARACHLRSCPHVLTCGWSE